MGSFNIIGSYSGIDMATIDQMIEAEKSKGVQFTKRKDKIEREQGAWKDIGSRLKALGQKNNLLKKASTYQSRIVKSNVKNSSNLSVTAGNRAQVGKYKITVNKLATSSKLVGTGINSDGNVDFIPTKDDQKLIDQKINIQEKSTLTFVTAGLEKDENGELIPTEFNIDINADDSLRDIIGKINSETKDSGIEANLIGNRLILKDNNMGERDIKITSNDLAKKLGFGLGNNQEISIENAGTNSKLGQQSEITVNDIEIIRDSNQITDAVDGLTIDLLEAGQTETVTVSNNNGKTVDAVKDFIDQYNSVMNFIEKQTDVGSPTEENNKTGALVGEGSIMRLQSGLRSELMKAVDIGAEKKLTASKIGIEIDRYGVATLDEGKLSEALQEDPANVARFFYQPETVETNNEIGTKQAASNNKGVSELLDNFIETYTSKSKGIISTKNKSYDRMVKDINRQIETFDARIEKKRDRYIKQFTALDQAMMQAESQMDYLYTQMGMGEN